jgi:hypothetical protein
MIMRHLCKLVGILSILGTFLCSGTLASAATMQVSRPWVQASGLVGYWSFNNLDVTDKVYDRSGQGNNAYFEGGATSTAKVSGRLGQGVRFDGLCTWLYCGADPK